MKHRTHMRMQSFDYSSHYSYFVTICTYKRQRAFGNISENGFIPIIPEIQKIFTETLNEMQNEYQGIEFDNTVIMPDHIHLLLTNMSDNNISLGDIVASFKIRFTKKYGYLVKQGKLQPYKNKLFQTNYYDHIITDDDDYDKTYDYITNNPISWWVRYGGNK